MASEMVTLDGFFAGPNGEIDWHVVDEEFNEFDIDQLNHVDTLLFGRVTYEMMASYWPTPAATENDPIVAERMNNLPKIVFSRMLDKVSWNNSKLVKENIAVEISRLKGQPGGDMLIFGSGSLVSTLTQHRLIDEYRIIVNPIILGRGKLLFEGIIDRLNLKLLKTKAMHSGNVILYYQPDIKDSHL
jgi:dihydrofolate reductase